MNWFTRFSSEISCSVSVGKNKFGKRIPYEDKEATGEIDRYTGEKGERSREGARERETEMDRESEREKERERERERGRETERER